MKASGFLLLILITLTSHAQTLVKGTITDEKGEALLGANVYFENTYDGASSDLEGKYSFNTSEKGLLSLKVEYMGYHTQVVEVEVNGADIDQSFTLEEAFNELDAVVITAGSFEASDRKRAIELTPIDVATTAGAMGDIAGAINTLPGTTPVGESGRLYVRGGSSEETKTYIDGLLVSKPYTPSAPNLSARGRFNPFLFSGTVFNTGGYSAEYGQALSSVLLLNTINAKQEDELNLSFLVGLGVDIAGTKSWEKGSVTVSGNYFNLQPYMWLVPQNQEWEKAPELVTQETSLKQETKNGLFKVYSNINQSKFSVYQNDLDNPGEQIKYSQQNNNYFLNTSWMTSISDKWILYTGLSTTFNKDDIELGTTPIREELKAAHAKVGLDYQPTAKLTLRIGSELMHDDYTFRSEEHRLQARFPYLPR